MFHVGAKSALLRHLFMPMAKKDVIRPLPCSSFPNRTRCAGLRFGFGRKPGGIGIYSVAIFHVGAKSALLRRLFMPMAKKDVIRPPPCSSFPTAPRCAGLAVGGPPCGRHFSRLRNCIFTGKFDPLCMETPVRQHKKRPGHLQIGRDRDAFS